MLPKSAAGTVLNQPPIVPIAVRQAPANTTFFAIVSFLHLSYQYYLIVALLEHF